MMYVKKVLSETLSVASQDVLVKGGAHTGETDPAQISDLGLDAALVVRVSFLPHVRFSRQNEQRIQTNRDTARDEREARALN